MTKEELHQLELYRKCEDKAAERWWKRHCSIDDELSILEDGLDEPVWLSDNGRGAEQIIDKIDRTIKVDRRVVKNKIDTARRKVMRNLPWCLNTFYAILRNGNNREKSICELQRIMQMKSDARRASRGTGGTSRGGMRRKHTSGNSRG